MVGRVGMGVLDEAYCYHLAHVGKQDLKLPSGGPSSLGFDGYVLCSMLCRHFHQRYGAGLAVEGLHISDDQSCWYRVPYSGTPFSELYT